MAVPEQSTFKNPPLTSRFSLGALSEKLAATVHDGTEAARRSDASFLNIVCQFWQFIDGADAFIVVHIASRGTGSHSGRSKDRPRLAVLFAESTIFRQMGKMLQGGREAQCSGT